jgi:hypothetical protein
VAKGEAAKTNTAIDNARNQQQAFQQNFNTSQMNLGNDAYNRNLTERNALTTGYGNMANTGGVTPEQEARLRGLYTGLQTSNSGGGGSATPDYTYTGNIGGVENFYNNLMGGGGVNRYALGTLQDLAGANGGISAENMGNIQSGISGFKGIGETGGYSPETLSRLQGQVAGIGGLRNLDPAMMARFNEGLGGYSEFANTGGWSDPQKANYMRQATSNIPSFYGQMRNQAQQANRVQGGYAPGMNASMRNLGREQASAAQGASREAQLGLQNQVNQGRQFGISGLTSGGLQGAQAMNDAAFRAQQEELNQGRGLQQDIVGNRLQGLSGQTQSAQALANAITDARLGASSGLNQIMNTDLQASMGGAAGLNQVIGNKAQESASNAAASNAAANQNYQNNLAMAKFGGDIERYLLDTQNQNKLAGLGGLGQTYTSAPAEYNMFNQNMLANQQMGGDQTQANLALRAQYNPNVSTWDKVMQGIQVGTGAAGAIMGGLGGVNGGGGNPAAGVGSTGLAGIPPMSGSSPLNPNNWYAPNQPQGGFTGWGRR